jgi:hypothetical protein
MVTVTRAEHLEWCKRRAKAYIEEGQLSDAVTSMVSDLQKHPETENHPGSQIGMMMMLSGQFTKESITKFIDGFN